MQINIKPDLTHRHQHADGSIAIHTRGADDNMLYELNTVLKSAGDADAMVLRIKEQGSINTAHWFQPEHQPVASSTDPKEMSSLAKDPKLSQFQGTIGQRDSRWLTCIHKKKFESEFGPGELKIFQDEDGNRFKCFGKCDINLEETAYFEFRVKEHDVYHEMKSTKITHMKKLRVK